MEELCKSKLLPIYFFGFQFCFSFSKMKGEQKGNVMIFVSGSWLQERTESDRTMKI